MSIQAARGIRDGSAECCSWRYGATVEEFEDQLPVIAERLGEEGFMHELSRGFGILMDPCTNLINLETLRNKAPFLGLDALSDDDLREMLAEGDSDGDGALSELEFCALMVRLSPDLMEGPRRWLDYVLRQSAPDMAGHSTMPTSSVVLQEEETPNIELQVNNQHVLLPADARPSTLAHDPAPNAPSSSADAVDPILDLMDLDSDWFGGRCSLGHVSSYQDAAAPKRKGTEETTSGAETEAAPKRACLTEGNGNGEADSIRKTSERLISYIGRAVETFKAGVGNDFLIQAPGDSEPDEYEGLPGVVLPEPTDPKLKRYIRYVQSDLEELQELLNANTLDKAALVSQIVGNLQSWDDFFRGNPPVEVKQLAAALQSLKTGLGGVAELQSPFCASELVSRKGRVMDSLKAALHAHRDAAASLDTLKRLNERCKMLSEQTQNDVRCHLAKVQELENQLNQERERLHLAMEKELEATRSLNDHDAMVNAASASLSELAELSTQGCACLKDIEEQIQHSGNQDMSLPKAIRSLLAFIRSCKLRPTKKE